MPLSPDVRRTTRELVALRRDIHRHPELGFREKRTQALIRRKLKAWSVEHRPMCGTGVSAIVRGAKPGPTILIRADMDGLPVQELNRVPYASRVPGVMHACGHDGHVAMGLIAARLLQKRRRDLSGNVRFMFQPAEEGPGGAGPMIEAGILKRPRVDAAFAIHVWNELPSGKVGIREGAAYASADEFRMKVVGKGGHGASPHETVDPVAVSAQVITACQQIVSRRTDPVRGGVVTFGQIHGGTRSNIIPDAVELSGTVRAFDERVRRRLKRDLPRIARGVAAALGAKVECAFYMGYPPTLNDPGMSAVAREAARAAVGKRAVIDGEPTMGAEDMSLVLREVPGCYLFLGSKNVKKGLDHPHHSARFDFDEAALPGGVEIWLRLAERMLGRNGR